MTQSNPPGEIRCPHCGQTYAIQPEQWPQYQGRSIACTKCGQQFAVSAGPALAGGTPPALPPAMPPAYSAPGYPPPGYGFPPPKKGMSGGVVAAIVIGVLAVLIIPCLIAILLPALNKVREEALKAKCASNMKNIAAAMITYSNTHSGEYPDSMSTLIRNSGMSPAVFVCPDSNDTPFTKSASTLTEADLVGHCSYIYAANGLNSNTSGTNDVLVYESAADHHTKGMNVLYGDYHVAWITKPLVPMTIQSINSRPPPPPPAPAIPQ